MKKYKDKLIKGFFALSGLLVIIILIAIFTLLIKNSLPFFKTMGIGAILRHPEWNPASFSAPKYGIISLVVSTLIVTLGAMLFAIPLGIACAAYLSEVASVKEREILKPFIEILAGIPSVVVGFFGLIVLNPIIAKVFGLSNGLTALNGSILLGIMSLPTIISLAEDAFSAVPKEYKEASLALGANSWQTLWKASLPAAKSGIIAALMLGMGRAIGETMTVLMVTGNVRAMPNSILDPVMTLTATIAIEMGEVAFNTTHYHALFVIGLVLFTMTIVVNLASDVILHRKRW